jgi:hypothetical protein
MDKRDGRRYAAPNKALEPTANSVRCAPAVGGGSAPALGCIKAKGTSEELFL